VNRRNKKPPAPPDGGRLWYKDAIIYEVPVRAFRDSNGDGVGDFRGLVEKLDYLQDLGVTALWLLPFYPSPLRDDGYDIADYRDIHPRYGTLADFKLFLREAHRRGLRVITELVVNHTSDQHPWFQRARHAPAGHPHRDFYVWSDSPDRYREARIIFKDFETSNWTWDPVAKAYYWHRFYSHQPDLNFDNPAVQEAVIAALDYWLELGIDGLRLDAVPYLYEREGTNCENLPETHAFLKKLRRHVDERYPGRMLLAEANQWPEDAVAYFGAGQGDECHMAFHFPVMPRLFMGIRMEDRLPILDILQQTPPIPPTAQWALFLRNHDELTLEMVTDEDRDYMYRVYARDPQARINLGIRRRLAPLLENHRPRIELMNGLLFSLPGTPVLYYGDEIGMGDNIYLGDRNGVRTPMQWTSGRNAGFSGANPQGLYLPLIIDPEYHFEAVNVEVQQSNPHSFLWWTKRLIDLRKRHPAFGRGSIRFMTPDNHKVLAFVRSYSEAVASGQWPVASEDYRPGPTSLTTDHSPPAIAEDDILVVANLSRVPQYVELDLKAFAGRTPVELMGRTPFPPITDRPYLITLGGYAFHWFSLAKRPAPAAELAAGRGTPTIKVLDDWTRVFVGEAKDALQEWLPAYLQGRPWFDGRGRQTEAAMVLETVPVPVGEKTVHVALVQVEYSEGDPETYVLPLAFATGPDADRIRAGGDGALVAGLRVLGREAAAVEGVLYDPTGEPAFGLALLEAVFRHRRFRRAGGELLAVPLALAARERLVPAGAAKSRNGPRSGELPALPVEKPSVLHGEQRHTSLAFGDRFVFKLFRRIEEGTHPEVEVETFLAEKTEFRNAARVAGALEYRRGWGEPMTLGILHEYVPHQGDGWHYFRDALDLYFERAKARPERGDELPLSHRPSAALAAEPAPALAEEMIGPALEAARVLGQRTGELHRALASRPDDPAFAPEPFTTLYQRGLYQALRSQTRQAFVLLRKHMAGLPEGVRAEAERLAAREEDLLLRVRRIYEHRITAWQTRGHGDYNLREVLYDGRDFTVVDFEGDANRPLSDRRRKYTPLRDVAGMLRSFHYAARLALEDGAVRQEDRPTLRPWARLWQAGVGAAFLRAYLEAAGTGILPASAAERDTLLNFYLVKRAVAELRAELTRAARTDRPARAERVGVPVEGLLQLLEADD
jgi:maltose alpha-D-glucosyltransferase/alpha-amylase